MTSRKAPQLSGLLGLLNLHHTARLFISLQGDRRVSLWLKVCAMCGLVYVFSPLDVVPDWITGVGLLDDIIVSLLIMQAFLDLAPREVVEEHCARMKIDPRKLFVDVPQTVEDALKLYGIAQQFRPRGTAAEQQDAPPRPPQPRAPYSAAPQAAPDPAQQPPYSRYSAYRRG